MGRGVQLGKCRVYPEHTYDRVHTSSGDEHNEESEFGLCMILWFSLFLFSLSKMNFFLFSW